MRRAHLPIVITTALIALLIQPANSQGGGNSRPGPYNSDVVPKNKEEAWQQMEQVIRTDFASWSGGDDHLTMKQVGQLERDGRITGQQAAALGLVAQTMVHQIKNDEGIDPSFTLDELVSKLHTNSVGARFLNIMQELVADADQGRELHLYGPSGLPTVEGIHQAGIGDCYALSAIEAVMHTYGPQYITRLIQPRGGNEFVVLLAARPITVKLTQAEIAQGNIDRDNGCWLQVLGIAMNKLKMANNSKPPKSEIAQVKRQQTRETPVGALSVGGSQPMALHWLTNERYSSVGRRSRRWNREEISRLLTATTSANRPIGVCTHGHCLSIIGWDPQTQVLTIMNPWGTSGHYAPNGTEKFMMNNGQFTVSLDQLLAMFASLSVPREIIASR